MDTAWYYIDQFSEVGPMTAADLKRHAADGRILPDTLVRNGDQGKWYPAQKVKGLLHESATLPARQSRRERTNHAGRICILAPIAAIQFRCEQYRVPLADAR